MIAVWQANNYVVKFDANNGTGTMASEELEFDTVYQLPANEFTRAGYTFKGWTASRTGGEFGATSSLGSSVTTIETLIANRSYIKNLLFLVKLME